MQFLWINFLAILIAFSTMVISGPEMKVFSAESDYYEAVPVSHHSPLRVPSNKSDGQLSYIAQDFIPIVAIATFDYQIRNYSYYLPFYSRYHEKDFFLLI